MRSCIFLSMKNFILILLMASWSMAATLDGTFILDAKNSADIAKAIEVTVADMNFVKRPIARSRLTKTNEAPMQVEVHQNAGKVDITIGKVKHPNLTLSASAIAWTTPTGEAVLLSVKPSANGLEETFQGEDGAKKNTFTLSTDGKTLSLDVLVTSPQLPKPLIYRLVFLRKN